MPATQQTAIALSSTIPAPSEAIGLKSQSSMKAITYDRYGSFENLVLREVTKPTIGADEVLVRVRASGLHVGDCFGVRGAPLPMRFVTGLFKPKRGVPGFDFSGEVAEVGEDVTEFKPGDEVFGECNGSCAEFVRVRPDKLAPKPTSLSFELAAALATSGLAALHALRDVANLQPGQRVLINGASGGVGTFAVQIAKSLGAEVTGVCSTGNVEMVRSIGADRVIDYTAEDFTKGDARYDVILDNVENRTLSDCRRPLAPAGTLILNSGTGARGMAMLIRLFKPLVLSPFLRQKLRRYLSVPNHDDLTILKDMVDSGKLRPVIDQVYPLAETSTALERIEAGHSRGKVVVTT